jgi:hypothetical protein
LAAEPAPAAETSEAQRWPYRGIWRWLVGALVLVACLRSEWFFTIYLAVARAWAHLTTHFPSL